MYIVKKMNLDIMMLMMILSYLIWLQEVILY